jgi:hypothetical protein
MKQTDEESGKRTDADKHMVSNLRPRRSRQIRNRDSPLRITFYDFANDRQAIHISLLQPRPQSPRLSLSLATDFFTSALLCIFP